MFDLILVFTGMCAFVPDKPIDNSPHKLTVSLVKTQDPEAPHIATLLVQKYFVNEAFTTAELHEEPNNPFFYYLNLDGFRVTVSPSGCTVDDNCLEFEYSGGNLGACPMECNREDLYWVGSMKKISNGSGEMSRVCHKEPNRARDRISAHFDLVSGKVAVADFSRLGVETEPRPIIKWEIDRPGTDFQQALADLVTVTQTIPQATMVFLVFERYLHGRWVEDSVLALTPDQDEDIVLVEIKNVPEDQVCPENEEEYSATANSYARGDLADRLYDPHFAEFSRLLYSNEQVGGLDYLRPPCTGLGEWEHKEYLCQGFTKRLNDPQCPSAWFEPSQP